MPFSQMQRKPARIGLWRQLLHEFLSTIAYFQSSSAFHKTRNWVIFEKKNDMTCECDVSIFYIKDVGMMDVWSGF